MNDDILITIESLTKRVVAREEEATKLKKLINELCGEAGVALRYPNIVEASGAVTAVRSDQFYGLTITTAIRNYLEQRKAAGLGAASLNEIYSAIRDGGYKFESKNEDNAKISVGNNLRKSSSIFHRLPNGQYGLLSWYPSAKAKTEDSAQPKKRGKEKSDHPEKGAIDEPDSLQPEPEKPKNDVSNKEIREIILEQQGEFQNSDIAAAVKAKYPNKNLPPTKIPTVIFLLKKIGMIKVLSERSGSIGAKYAKA